MQDGDWGSGRRGMKQGQVGDSIKKDLVATHGVSTPVFNNKHHDPQKRFLVCRVRRHDAFQLRKRILTCFPALGRAGGRQRGEGGGWGGRRGGYGG